VSYFTLRAPRQRQAGAEEGAMRTSSFAIVVALIVAATGFGVWAAARTAHHENPHDQDLHHGSPVGGGLFVMPPVY
jgi:hypothetical protein